MHVGHWQARLRTRQRRLPDFGARRLVVRVKDRVSARTFSGMIGHHGIIYTIYCPGNLAAGREEIVSTVVDIFLQGIAK